VDEIAMTKAYTLAQSASSLMARAREMTGIDLLDSDAVEPLTVLLKSFNEESRLHQAGTAAMEKKLLRLLCNRLRMQRDFAAHPEIADQKIEAPIVICGMGRTGSTKLQKLLAASGDFNWLPYWQSHNPCLHTGSRSETVAPRIREAEEYCQWFDQSSPENKYGHAIEAHEPDEESYMLEQSLRTPCFIGWSELPSYMQWLAGQDLTAQFTYLRDLLKYLQWQGLQSEERRWVLKCPLYFGLEPLLLSVFPDACLVMTHRHPSATIPSSCRLLETFHMPFTHAPIDPKAFFEGTVAQINQHLQIRRMHDDIRILDLPFLQIVQEPLTVAGKVYNHCGVELRAEAKQKILEWDNNNPQNKQGVHKYSLADFGFTESDIEEGFKDYIDLISRL